MGERDGDKDNKKRKLFKNRKNIKKRIYHKNNNILSNSLIFFYKFIYKIWNINSGNVDILFSSYIFILLNSAKTLVTLALVGC